MDLQGDFGLDKVDQYQQTVRLPKSSLTVKASHSTSINQSKVLICKGNTYFYLKKNLHHWPTVLSYWCLALVHQFWSCVWFRSDLTQMGQMYSMSQTCLCVCYFRTTSRGSTHLVYLPQTLQWTLLYDAC